jgi:5-formyltetrahydrofolate cyclo-ligase
VAYCREFASICTPSGANGAPPTIMLYVPIRGEVDPIRLALWAFQAGWRVCVGYGIDRESPLQPVELPADAVTKGTWDLSGFEDDAWGVAVPSARTPVRVQALDMVVVPGVAFDTHCHRLGRGAGVYDRFLASLGSATRRVGVVTDTRLVPALPHEAHDVPMHLVATDRRVVRPTA